MSTTNSTTLKGAVIGYGFISSKGHIPAYLERQKTQNDVEIIAICDTSAERRAIAEKDLPGIRTYASAEELFAKEAKNLDFVDIAAPACDHASIAHQALEQGLHVLCEKPLTTTTEDARQLLKHAIEAKRVLFPCHNYKHAPVVQAINEVIESGAIGKVRLITLNTFRNTHAKGVLEWLPHWRRQHKYSGGGIAMDHGSHSFYLTFDWLGSYPTAITAKMSNLEPHKYDTEDNFTATLTFPTGLAFVNLTWTAGVRKVIYSIQGEQGAITVDDDEMQIALMKSTDGPDIAHGAVEWQVERKTIRSDWMDSSHVTWFNKLFDQFRSAIHKQDYVGQEAVEAYLCVQTIETAYQSAAQSSKELRLNNSHPVSRPEQRMETHL